MKKLLFFIAVLFALTANAQTYLISFAGTGASSTVTSVKVENLTANTVVNLTGSQILRLNVLTGIKPPENIQLSSLKTYPNPMNGTSVLQVTPPVSGNAVITVTDINGKQIAQIQSYLENYLQEFNISGFPDGLFLISVRGNGWQHSGKLICTGESQGKISIEKISNNIQVTDKKKSERGSKSSPDYVDMPYTTGDILKYTSVSGDYSTVSTDIPEADKTITFNFVPCTDQDNNKYSVVELGTQIWMAENLRTTKYSAGASISLLTADASWGYPATAPGYCWYENNEATYKNIYGALYNWDAVNTGNLCPTGWHVPGDDEWITLEMYLGVTEQQANLVHASRGTDEGAKLKEQGTAHWNIDAGNNANLSGFTALPGGFRPSIGSMNMGDAGFWWSSTTSNEDPEQAWFRELTGSATIWRSFDPKERGFSVRCVKDNLPVLTTSIIKVNSSTSASGGGNISFAGGDNVTARGACWSTSANPTISDSKSVDGNGTGIFSSNLTGLSPNTIYHVRAYATNSIETGYGRDLIFKTYTGTVTDVDANVYNTVTIGIQIWMAENLKTTRLNNSSAIPLVTDNTAWSNLITPGYCWYNNEATNKDIYGALYNWYTVNTGNLCPTGWHVPADEEWTALTTYLGGDAVASVILKESGLAHWKTPNTGATNETGFTALPGGFRFYTGGYFYLYENGLYWTSTEKNNEDKLNCGFAYNTNIVSRLWSGKRDGLSVRCVKGVLPVTSSVTVNSPTAATGGGIISADASSSVIKRGVCWSTSKHPTISDSKTENGSGSGSFSSSITGLTPNSTYYIRAYETNSAETLYGNELVFKTYTGTITDVDANVYNTVSIGTQVWIAENLKTTRYRNGNSIGTTDPSTKDIQAEISPKYEWAYDSIESNAAIYGRLYTWYAATDSRGLCPTGWHLPSTSEWEILNNFLIDNGYSYDGNPNHPYIAKSMANSSGWTFSSVTGAAGNTDFPEYQNISGFSAMPAGIRGDGYLSIFFTAKGTNAVWWSSTEATSTKPWYASFEYNKEYFSAASNSYSKKVGSSVRCVKDEVPTITTTAISTVGTTTASGGGNVTNDCGSAVSHRGVCWSLAQNPTITDSKTDDGGGTGSFASALTGLIPNTIYHVRAYATNSTGTGYGNDVIFKTYTGTVTDIDLNVYNTVTIGTQVWMAENLKTTKYNDDTTIPLTTSYIGWSNLITPGFCWYNNDIANKPTYGAIYNWYTVNTGKLCPSGWHAPSDSEWMTLINYLGGNSIAAAKMKEAGVTHWIAPNTGATNESYFYALPAGYRDWDGTFYDIYYSAIWWSSTSADQYSSWYQYLETASTIVTRNSYYKESGFSVRCLKD